MRPRLGQASCPEWPSCPLSARLRLLTRRICQPPRAAIPLRPFTCPTPTASLLNSSLRRPSWATRPILAITEHHCTGFMSGPSGGLEIEIRSSGHRHHSHRSAPVRPGGASNLSTVCGSLGRPAGHPSAWFRHCACGPRDRRATKAVVRAGGRWRPHHAGRGHARTAARSKRKEQPDVDADGAPTHGRRMSRRMEVQRRWELPTVSPIPAQ